jgi:hypothetical protein
MPANEPTVAGNISEGETTVGAGNAALFDALTPGLRRDESASRRFRGLINFRLLWLEPSGWNHRRILGADVPDGGGGDVQRDHYHLPLLSRPSVSCPEGQFRSSTHTISEPCT